MSRSRPYAAGRCPVPRAADLVMASLVRTVPELAADYGTTPAVVRSWLEDARAGRALVASAYVPTNADVHERARAGLDAIVARVIELSANETLDKCVRAGDFLLRVTTALGLATPEERDDDEPDIAGAWERAMATAARESALRN